MIERLEADGWRVQRQDNLLTAEKCVIAAKWLLGSRRVEHRLRVRTDTPAGVVRFQETAKETTVGIPPPTLSITKTGQRGLMVTEERSDRSLGGGGHLHFGEMRDWFSNECVRQGWKFETSIGPP